MNNDRCDVAIVGGGPIGIETAIALRNEGLNARILEAGVIGHTISWWAPHTRWFSSNDRIAIAGIPLHTIDQSKASREEYLNYLRGVVDQFQVPVSTFTRVQAIEPLQPESGDASLAGWKLELIENRVDSDSSRNALAPPRSKYLTTRAVVLAIGGTDFPNRLGVDGESLPHVDGYLREVHRYHGRRVLIVGGRNSAVEATIRLHRGGANVALCYHRESLPEDGIKYWLRPEINGLISSGAITAYFGCRVTSITPDKVMMQRQNGDGTSTTITARADDVLTLIGYQQNQTLFEQLGILVAKQPAEGQPVPEPDSTLEVPPSTRLQPSYDPETMQTSRPGIYVAGTAIGGTQSSRYQIFLENCHDHADKITRHLMAILGGIESPTRGIASASQATLSRQIEMHPES